MSDQEQTVICEFLEILKKNPNILSSVLQTTLAASHLNGPNSQKGLPESPGTSSVGISSSSDEEAAQNGATDKATFTAEDLLARRSRKGKGSNKAQQTFRFVMRESAKKCGIWDRPPLMREISAKTLEVFTKKVISALPQLDCHGHDIRRRLSESLIYRRNQLKNTKFWKRAKMINKYKSEACQRPVVIPEENPIPIKNTTLIQVEKSLHAHNTAEVVAGDDLETGFSFTPSEELFIMDGSRKIARATFLRTSKADSDFKKLVMQSNFLKGDEKIKLNGPNTEKFLCDIKVGEKFYWPENQLLSSAKSRPNNKLAKDVKTVPSARQGQATPRHVQLAESVPTDLYLVKKKGQVIDLEKSSSQTKGKDVKTAPSKPKGTQTKSNKKNQDQVTPPQPTDLDKQIEQENNENSDHGLGEYALSKYKGYVYVPISKASACTPEPPLPKKRRRLQKISLDFDYTYM